MEPVAFPQANRRLDAPKGMDNCVPLPVWTDDNVCISCWKPTLRERLSVLIFGRVWLWVYFGRTQPPVALMAQRRMFAVADDVQ